MYTKVVTTNAGEICIHADGTCNNRKTHYVKAEDIVNNADGSYSISVITEARNAEVAMAMDTGLTLMYDEDAGVWRNPFKV